MYFFHPKKISKYKCITSPTMSARLRPAWTPLRRGAHLKGVMFIKKLPVHHIAHIVIAIPFLIIGVVSVVCGAYYISINEDLTAIWLLLLGFGATSISTLLVARVKFLSKPFVRRFFTYPFFAATLFFVSYLAIGILNWAWHGVAQEHNKNQNAAYGSSDAFSTRPFALRYVY